MATSLSKKRSPAKVDDVGNKKSKLVQTFLDFGQKNVGLRKCSCGMNYQPGVEQDEKMHSKLHSQFLNSQLESFKWINSPKNLLLEFDSRKERIILLDQKTPKKPCLERFNILLERLNEELGAVALENLYTLPKFQAYVYIKDTRLMKNQVIGLLLVQEINEAYRAIRSIDKSVLCRYQL